MTRHEFKTPYDSLMAEFLPMSRDEETRLSERMKTDPEEVHMILWKHNLRFAVHLAVEAFGRKTNSTPLSLSDLTHAAVDALWRSAQAFEFHRGSRFTSYATWGVKRALQETIRGAATGFTLPRQHLKRLSEARAQRATGVPSRMFSQRQLDMALARHTDPIFIDARVPDGQPVAETITSGAYVREQVEREDNLILLGVLIDKLEKYIPRSPQIIRDRYGLDGKPRMTLEEVAHKMGITRQRVEQLESRAMRRLRASLACKNITFSDLF